MKNYEIVGHFNNLCGIIEKNEKYPVKLSFAIYKNMKILEPLAKEFEEAKARILEVCGIKNVDGTFQRKKSGEYEILDEHKSKWEKDIRELLDIDVKVEPQMVSVCDYPEDIEPALILALEFMTKNEN